MFSVTPCTVRLIHSKPTHYIYKYKQFIIFDLPSVSLILNGNRNVKCFAGK